MIGQFIIASFGPMKEDHRFGSTIRGKVRRPPEEQYLREILHGFEVLGGWVARLSRWQKTIAGDATAINYNLWPWVGRASEPLQNQGFQHAVPGGVFGQGRS